MNSQPTIVNCKIMCSIIRYIVFFGFDEHLFINIFFPYNIFDIHFNPLTQCRNLYLNFCSFLIEIQID